MNKEQLKTWVAENPQQVVKRAIAFEVAKSWRETHDTVQDFFEMLVGEFPPPENVLEMSDESLTDFLWEENCEDEECAQCFVDEIEEVKAEMRKTGELK
jgi:hypothetical protein